MPVISAPITADGIILDVTVSLTPADVRALQRAGGTIPVIPPLRGLVDTGCDVSAVDEAQLTVLMQGIRPVRFVLANVPAAGGVIPRAVYAVNLTIRHPSGSARANLVMSAQPVVDLALGLPAAQVLIGRDILSRCAKTYDGLGGQFTLSY
jgi:hypothetical protein